MAGDVAVIRAGALGDLLLGLPALWALRRQFPDSQITLVAPMPQARLAQQAGCADAVVPFDDPALASVIAATAIQLPPVLASTRTAVLWLRSWQEPAKTLERLGVGSLVASAPFPPPGERVHASDWLLRSLTPLRVTADAGGLQPPHLQVASSDRAVATQALTAAGVRGPYAVLHPGSGSRRKNWHIGRWLEVLEALPHDLPIVVTFGPADGEVVGSLKAAWPAQRRAPIALPPMTLETLSGVLAGATLYLGNDSGVSHLAGAVGAPTVAVFGPTDPAVWAPRGRRVAALGGAPASDQDGIFAADPAWPSVDEAVQAARGMLSAE
jgi:heptosyltransferase III